MAVRDMTDTIDKGKKCIRSHQKKNAEEEEIAVMSKSSDITLGKQKEYKRL